MKRATAVVALALAVIAGTAAVVAAAAVSIDPATEIRPGDTDADAQQQVPGNRSPSRVPSDHVPRPAGNALATSNPGLGVNVAGLNFEDQRTADGGNQFSLEPPDQALCVGNGSVFEAVNTVFRVYSTSGAPMSGVAAWNPFFTQDHAFDRTTGVVGEDLFDPKCYYDPANGGHFFFVVDHIGTDEGASLEIAVSKKGVPTTNRDDWFFYELEVTNDGEGGTPDHAGCPCFGDQPLVGADQNGFYITTNEFSLEPFGAVFNGAQIYAFDKAALTTGTMKVQRIEGAPLASSYTNATDTPYSLQPASSPSAADWSGESKGTEYMLGALDFTKKNVALDDRVAVWALTNTASLTTANPSVQVDDVLVTTQAYGFPPDVVQKKGPTPLGDSAPQTAGKKGNGPKEHENLIAANDDRMQDAVWVSGKLWGALNTVVKTKNGPTGVGAAYFAFTPSVSGSQVAASVARQGYVALNGNSVLYPAIAMNAAGNGAVVFTVAGPDYFPSAAYAPLTLAGGAGSIHIAAPGAKPADGFTGYKSFGGSGTERWGDYSDAVANSDGSLWLATEWIQGNVGFPPRIANWNTRIMSVTP